MGASLVYKHLAPAAPSLTGLSSYQAVERACADMLAAARRDDWEAVSELRTACGTLIDSMRKPGPDDAPAAIDKKERFQILRRIVLLDGQLRQLSEPWVRNLDAMLSARQGAASARQVRT